MITEPVKDFYLFKSLFDEDQAARYVEVLETTTPWRHDKITIQGNQYDIPRLHQWFADPDMTYSWSGITMTPTPWTFAINEIKNIVEEVTEHSYNSCLVNLYRNENDSVGFHADKEKELGDFPVIASLSFGATRDFVLKRKKTKELSTITLSSGDMVVMKDRSQKDYLHSIPATKEACGKRINLTFRTIYKI